MTIVRTYSLKLGAKFDDLKQLVKFRLSLMVVFTSMLSFAIAAGSNFEWLPLIVLGVGGFMVTAAANTLNQVLEREYDSMMSRTANRPLAAQRMQVSEAVIIAGFLCLGGIILLALFNPLTAFMGMLSLVIYAFIYTPLKRYHPVSVAIGAIPGALPVLIGCVAFDGTITTLAVVLFSIQFIWQFPHFWAIGVLSFDEYKKAGFRVMPETNGALNPQLGLHTLIYSILLLPVCLACFYTGLTNAWMTLAILIATGIFVHFTWQFYRAFDRQSARALMFSSFAYLPVMFLIIYLGIIL